MTIQDILDRGNVSMLPLEQRQAAFWEANTRACDKEALNFAEFGVHRAGTAAIIATCIALSNMKIHLHLFDSWNGQVQKVDAIEHLKRFGLDKHCVYHEGFFQNTVPKFQLPIMFAHVDCGEYVETVAVLKRVLDLMHKRGSVIVQNAPCQPSIQSAVREAVHGGWFIQPTTLHNPQWFLISKGSV